MTILIAEDDDGHAYLLRKRLEAGGLAGPIIRFSNGAEAWAFLSGETSPGLIPGEAYILALDIGMPEMDGIEVLKRVKAHPRLKGLPVIMLTTSDAPEDKRRCLELGCSDYLTKPEGFDKIVDLIKAGF
ncbi:MAG: hypothetical protein AUJ51_00560 [Elusimicrobia bacterium CG1_02_56_21]|nr:MAG: hypothetical protein AUJ51_00560 [Elusimicrobia bacterium CG1_02_56_21]